MFRDSESSPRLDQIVAALGAADIVLVEGFHEEPRAKIEVLSDRNDERLCKTDENLLAIVAPTLRESAVPMFTPSEIEPLADLIERDILVRKGHCYTTKDQPVW